MTDREKLAPAPGREELREAARKVAFWVKCGMPDQSGNTPTRNALKRDIQTVLSALQGEGEAVAWRYRWRAGERFGKWVYCYDGKPTAEERFDEPCQIEVQPLYASPALHPQGAACGGASYGRARADRRWAAP